MSEPTAAAESTSWPTPDKQVTVLGRSLPLDLLVVAGLYALAGLWLVWNTREVFGLIPDVIGGLFSSSSFEFLVSWAIFAAVLLVLYVAVALFAIAYLLFVTDRLGRGLAAVVTAMLFGVAASAGNMGGSDLFILLVAGIATAVLFLSPWCKRAFAASTRNDGRPGSVVLSSVLGLSLFSLLAVLSLLLVVGLRFAGDFGAKYVIATLFAVAGSVLALMGLRKLKAAPDTQGRLWLTVGAAAALLGMVLPGEGGNFSIIFIALACIVLPLWVAPSARAWFGESPLNITGYEQK